MSKTIKQYLDREFSIEERTAIGELVNIATMMTDEKTNKPHSKIHQAIGAIILERAANILRQEVEPITPDMDYMREFAKFWKINKRAKFNQVNNGQVEPHS